MQSDQCSFGMHDVCRGYVDLSADFAGYCTCACHGGIRQPAVEGPPKLPGYFWLSEPHGNDQDSRLVNLTL